MQPVPLVQIVPQRSNRSRVQHQFSGLAELAVPHQQQPALGVEVVPVGRERLADPHAGHGQQRDQCADRRPPQRRGQRLRRRDQRGDVGRRIQVRDRPPCPPGQQIGGRDLHGRVEGVQVGGEAPHHRKPVCPPVHVAGGQAGPGQRRVDSHHRGACVLEVVEELAEQLLWAHQPISQRAAHGQVVAQRVAQRRGHHRSPPVVCGQGWASTRSASRSTLA